MEADFINPIHAAQDCKPPERCLHCTEKNIHLSLSLYIFLNLSLQYVVFSVQTGKVPLGNSISEYIQFPNAPCDCTSSDVH